MAKQRGKDASAALATQLIVGVQKHLANGQSAFAGGQFTATQIVGQLQKLVDLRAAVSTAQAATKVKVDAETALAPALDAFMNALVQFVRVAFGTQADVLADFGLPPRKVRTPLTVEQKALAAAKAKATREARGTKSAKAKKGIVGAVTSVVITPVVAGAPVVQPASAPVVTPTTGK
ncbi:MAG TPA: hypothetical protein VIF09_24365 [Polyangiaceae bacterium]